MRLLLLCASSIFAGYTIKDTEFIVHDVGQGNCNIAKYTLQDTSDPTKEVKYGFMYDCGHGVCPARLGSMKTGQKGRSAEAVKLCGEISASLSYLDYLTVFISHPDEDHYKDLNDVMLRLSENTKKSVFLFGNWRDKLVSASKTKEDGLPMGSGQEADEEVDAGPAPGSPGFGVQAKSITGQPLASSSVSSKAEPVPVLKSIVAGKVPLIEPHFWGNADWKSPIPFSGNLYELFEKAKAEVERDAEEAEKKEEKAVREAEKALKEANNNTDEASDDIVKIAGAAEQAAKVAKQAAKGAAEQAKRLASHLDLFAAANMALAEHVNIILANTSYTDTKHKEQNSVSPLVSFTGQFTVQPRLIQSVNLTNSGLMRKLTMLCTGDADAITIKKITEASELADEDSVLYNMVKKLEGSDKRHVVVIAPHHGEANSLCDIVKLFKPSLIISSAAGIPYGNSQACPHYTVVSSVGKYEEEIKSRLKVLNRDASNAFSFIGNRLTSFNKKEEHSMVCSYWLSTHNLGMKHIGWHLHQKGGVEKLDDVVECMQVASRLKQLFESGSVSADSLLRLSVEDRDALREATSRIKMLLGRIV